MTRIRKAAVLLMTVSTVLAATSSIAQADDSNVTVTGGSLTLGSIATSDFGGSR